MLHNQKGVKKIVLLKYKNNSFNCSVYLLIYGRPHKYLRDQLMYINIALFTRGEI
jgi:hypothetical protein